MRKIALITTGGTIEKTYDEQTGELANRRSIVRRMLAELRLEETEIEVREVMSKDSLDMTAADREEIARAVCAAEAAADGVVVLHGTDTLAQTGECLLRNLGAPRVPIVLTGAMRPFEMKQSDALQNLTEAIFATGALPPGIYCAAHGRVLAFPGVKKDVARGTFVKG